MTELLPYRSQQQRSDETASLGLLIFLASWAMLFAAALFVYGALRLHAAQWPPPGVPRPSPTLPAMGIVILFAVSASMQLGIWRIGRGRPLELSAALILALLFGLLFLGLQGVLWRQLELAGIHFQGGPYGAVMQGVLALFALHVTAGVGGIALLLSRSFDGNYSAPRHLPVRLWTLYWHFLSAVWVVLFLLVFAV